MIRTDAPIPVTLHPGAHFGGLRDVHAALRDDATGLLAEGLTLWTSEQTRAGLLDGLLGDPGQAETTRVARRLDRAAGRIAMRRQKAFEAGARRILLSEPALLGTRRENVLMARLYPTAWPRLRRLRGVMPDIDTISLMVRNPVSWWSEALASLTRRCIVEADAPAIAAMARSRRGWREVVEDIADALPRARLVVWTYEDYGGDARASAMLLAGRRPSAVIDPGAVARPTAPFDPEQRAALDAAYEDDLTWLRTGAGGLAQFVTGRPTATPAAD